MALKGQISFYDKLTRFSWGYLLLISMVAGIGFIMLYSAAGGDLYPWAMPQIVRFGIALGALFILAFIDIRYIFHHAYTIYGVVLFLLILVDVLGFVGMGAQRWINLGFMRLQPSELMKIAVVLALARYFHATDWEDTSQLKILAGAAMLVLMPVALVLKQPDLGTALVIMMGGAAVLYFAGVRLWVFITGIVAGLIAIPVGFHFLHDYQKNRVLTFLDPERDPLGAGYHILQSKIAFGSGGLFGKGFLQGSQAHLNFLPEKQTDFIFTMLAEEFGLIGGMGLMVLYVLITGIGLLISINVSNRFGRLLGLGLTTNFFLYYFINMAMVMGLLPVVGVPLPLVSYGGTAMLAVMMGFGLLMNLHIHSDTRLTRRGALI